MSTKIYNGWKLPTDPFTFTSRLRPLLRQARDELHLEAMSEIAADKVDAATLVGEEPSNVRAQVWAEWDEKCQKITDAFYDTDANPFTFEATFGVDEASGTVCALLFDSKAERYRQIWESLGATEFGYWNNTDRPDELTDEQWREREEIWSRLLPGAGVPAEEMLSFTLDSYKGAPISTMGRDLTPPSLPERARRQARSQLHKEAQEHFVFDRDKVYQYVRQTQAWVAERVEERAELIAPRLLPDISHLLKVGR